ncbi:MAG: U32 family peptidase [Bacteriovoracaceae bacterium]|nr:U32 family peptidase [Bacteriovoracaceae bacterium]
MKAVVYYDLEVDLAVYARLGVGELLLAPKILARFGNLTILQTKQIYAQCKLFNIRPVVVWDILMTQNQQELLLPEVRSLLEDISIVRLQDHGALYFVLNHFSKVKIQLILESGNHNYEAIYSWCNYVGPSLDRVILSPEIPKLSLQKYLSNMQKSFPEVSVEMQGIGRILLFYSPRNLLSPHLSNTVEGDEIYRALGTSEESPHKGFVVIENLHGTFMFNTLDFCLLEHISELQQMGLTHFRIDLDRIADLKLSLNYLGDLVHLLNAFDPKKAQVLKKQYPHKLIRGFYNVNKTDVIFPKLKNHRLQKRDETFLGEVCEVSRKKYIAIKLMGLEAVISAGANIELVTPDGKKMHKEVKILKNSSLTEVEQLGPGQIAFINHIRGVSVATMVYLSPEAAMPHEKRP